MRTDNASELPSSLLDAERAEEARLLADALADKVRARVRVALKCGDLDGAEAFLSAVLGFLASQAACCLGSTGERQR